ncbi:MAG: DNA polymerase/3'-5' exonuclease PolX [Actinobacteria bacterium]|nr:DNA polymerase/3'-5' exonuclease PolX [Actinomycetota bacterium]
MGNEKIAEVIQNIGDLLEILGENPFRVRAYHRAANSIRGLTQDIDKTTTKKELDAIPGIGSGIADRIMELVRTGQMEYYEDLKERVPPSLLELMRVPTVGPKKAKQFYDELKITSVDQLYEAASKKLLRILPRMSEKAEQNILDGISQLRRYHERILLYEAYPIAERMILRLVKESYIKQADMAGSLRRMKETIGDIDLLVSSNQPSRAADFFCSLPEVDKVLAKGPTKCSVVVKTGLQIDLRIVAPKEYGSALQYFTGSKEHSIHLRDIAKKRGLKINEYGIFNVKTDKKLGGEREEDISELLEMQMIPPTMRENKGEIEVAIEHRLPDLIELKDIKGDLHLHSNWSDGLSKIKDIVEFARSIRYSYVGICDHAERLKVAGGLTPRELARRKKEIDKLNDRLDDFVVLSGIELNIDSKGEVDYSDEVLEEFDIVVASIHGGFSQSKEQITNRTLSAMNNKHIDIIGHPTGRIIGKRPPYEIDIERVLNEAKNTGTFLELNSFPDRLDLKDDHLRMAKEIGAKIAISTDAHIASQMIFINYGVATAQRGWLSRNDVVNTRSVDELLKCLKSVV